MKKFVALILSLISIFTLFGCTTEMPGVDPVSPAPWVHNGNSATAYEKSVYRVVKYDKVRNVEIAEGELSFEIAPVQGETDNVDLSTFTTNFTLTFNDNAEDADKGKTDTITSTVLFASKTLIPRYSEKTVTLADRDDPTTNQSFTLVNDYVAGISILTKPKMNFSNTINFADVQRLNVYDNETIYLYLRAYPGLTNSISGNLKLANFYEMHHSGYFYTTPITFATGATDKDIPVEIGTSLVSKYLNDQGDSVNAFMLQFSIDSNNGGTPEQVYFSKSPFVIEPKTTEDGKDKTTSLVIVKLVKEEYNYLSAGLQFTTEFTLTNYTTEQ